MRQMAKKVRSLGDAPRRPALISRIRRLKGRDPPETRTRPMPDEALPNQDPVLQSALRMLPEGHYLMTAAFEGQRAGVRLRSVQRCADDPILLAVASRKGHAIDPLIRDSRSFAICLVEADDRLLDRTFPPAPVAIHRST